MLVGFMPAGRVVRVCPRGTVATQTVGAVSPEGGGGGFPPEELLVPPEDPFVAGAEGAGAGTGIMKIRITCCDMGRRVLLEVRIPDRRTYNYTNLRYWPNNSK